MTTPTDAQIFAHAKNEMLRQLQVITIDDDAEIIRFDDGSGALVQAWIMVDFADMREET